MKEGLERLKQRGAESDRRLKTTHLRRRAQDLRRVELPQALVTFGRVD